jgi:hypothetical protein
LRFETFFELAGFWIATRLSGEENEIARADCLGVGAD